MFRFLSITRNHIKYSKFIRQHLFLFPVNMTLSLHYADFLVDLEAFFMLNLGADLNASPRCLIRIDSASCPREPRSGESHHRKTTPRGKQPPGEPKYPNLETDRLGNGTPVMEEYPKMAMVRTGTENKELEAVVTSPAGWRRRRRDPPEGILGPEWYQLYRSGSLNSHNAWVILRIFLEAVDRWTPWMQIVSSIIEPVA